MSILNREMVINQPYLKKVEVDVSRLCGVDGTTAFVYETTARERIEYINRSKQITDAMPSTEYDPESAARLVALVLRDDCGNRIFTDDDVTMLANCSMTAIDAIYTTSLKLDGLLKEHNEEKNV